jgi:hypothetical protein
MPHFAVGTLGEGKDARPAVFEIDETGKLATNEKGESQARIIASGPVELENLAADLRKHWGGDLP